MVLDECLAHPADGRRGARVDGAHAALGPPRRAIAFLALRDGLVPRRPRHQSRPGAVRHRAGQRVSGAARGERAADRRRSGSRRYAIGGLSVGEPADVMYDMVVAHDAVPARRPAALSDGHRHAGGPGRVGRARHRPVRLRAADPQRPQRPALHERRGASTSRTRGMPRTTGRSDPACALLHLPHAIRGPICAICFMAGEINAATLNTLHNLHFYLDTLRRIRDAIAFGRFESFRLAFHQQLVPPAARFMIDYDDADAVFAMGARRGRQPAGCSRSVRARPRHLLFHHPAADASASSRRCRSFSTA